MQLVKPSFEVMRGLDTDTLLLIEQAGRVCYKSEASITEGSANRFCRRLSDNGHASVIEHSSVTVRFITDRGVTHELVRHRLASFSQESTRYVNYQKKGIAFIIPPWCDLKAGEYLSIQKHLCSDGATAIWMDAMFSAEDFYNRLLRQKWQPQQARAVLPNSLKTEIVTTANLREWKHIFNMRTSNAAHPQIREIMTPLQEEFRAVFPEIF